MAERLERAFADGHAVRLGLQGKADGGGATGIDAASLIESCDEYRHEAVLCGLAELVQTAPAEDLFKIPVFVFRGRRGDILKVLLSTAEARCCRPGDLERGRLI
ncbi:IS66 family insertion sequence element accessory protein TnpB [Variovorax sp. GB1R11]|uniref:IS66 family insertion sequence element accessory protein TnpB n=1 Tax=Variovorax sp. GB1R11 TaxID=3443741 RepID=UPI003F47E6B5